MTLITPVPPWRARTLRFIWKVTRLWFTLGDWLRRWTPLKLWRYPFGQLEKLAFIHFAHWSLIDRIPPNSSTARRLDHPYMLFQTNFNRGWREYVEAFCLVIPVAMRLNWRFMYGFPPPKPVGPFMEYVEKRFTKDAHFYSAYPDSSTRMVLSAIEDRHKFNVFAAEASGPPARFLPEARRRELVFLTPASARAGTISVMTPVLPGRQTKLRRVLEGLPKDVNSPLAQVAGTHMARWSVVCPLPHKKAKATDPTYFLLFTSWFDGSIDEYVSKLRTSLEKTADDIWGYCVGYPWSKDPAKFAAYFAEHSITPRLAFTGYSENVTDVRASLELRRRLTRPVIQESTMDSIDLERAWLKQRGRHLGRKGLRRALELIQRFHQ